MADDRCRSDAAEESPNTTRQHAAENTRALLAKAGSDGKCRRKQTAGARAAARVKRRGKSPPPGAQAPGHDKPHAVQDKTGSGAWPLLPGNSRPRACPGGRAAAKADDAREMIIHDRIRLIVIQMEALPSRGAPLLFLGVVRELRLPGITPRSFRRCPGRGR